MTPIEPLNIEEPTKDETPTRKDGIGQLTLAEIDSLRPIFDRASSPMPHPSSCTYVGKVEDGKVVAFLVLQTKLHAEPMYIEPGYSSSFPLLVSFAEKLILEKAGPQWVYCFCPAGKVTQLAATVGMQMEPWVVMSKLVMPEPPAKALVDLSPITDTEQ